MKYLLDTNIVIYTLKNRPQQVKDGSKPITAGWAFQL